MVGQFLRSGEVPARRDLISAEIPAAATRHFGITGGHPRRFPIPPGAFADSGTAA
jgi:hypothetical protein